MVKFGVEKWRDLSFEGGSSEKWVHQPAPNKYDIQRNSVNSPRFSFSKTDSKDGSFISPGPGDYTPKYLLVEE